MIAHDTISPQGLTRGAAADRMGLILDAWLFHRIYGWFHQPLLVPVMSGLTHLGDTWIIVALALLGILETRRRAPGGRRLRLEEASPPAAGRRRRASLIPWLGIGAAMGITGWLKILVTRPRPAAAYPALGLVAPDVGCSFPSGHATGAFAVATALSLRWPKGRWLWFSLASGVALSRVALGMHWPSDVVVGALIGSGVVIGLSLGLRRWLQVE